ncbi:potassium/sodium hyperpolarization-activated cyclic nucleotide-gated channel 3-like [Engraulis encrasicolus]|uniref:potassium/sodium hyperpolarization-activated cyclic nucleotide-gated channel 3-like n=1 Tax=Engraulis encrasicolus TaxID=184585 RepID=UPI002FD11FEE
MSVAPESDVLGNSTNPALNNAEITRPWYRRKHSIFLPEINKTNLQYFGSKYEIANEIVRTKKQGSFVIHPQSLFRAYWLWIMIVVTGINMLVVPLDVSFFGPGTWHIYDISFTVYSVLVDLAFLADLCLNFRTGYLGKNAKAIVDLQSIKLHYLRTWFTPDLLAVLPCDYCLRLALSVGSFDSITTTRVKKASIILSLLRLLRVLRLFRYVSECMEGLSMAMRSVLELIYTIFGIFLICHWNACFQFMLAHLTAYPHLSWVYQQGVIAKPIHMQYTIAMFRSLCHMMTLNYGSKVPRGLTEQWEMIVSMTVGTVLYALVLAKITALVATFNISHRAYDERKNELKVYVRHKRVPEDLIPRVFGHMENCYQGRWFDEKEILSDLSEPLKLAVMEHICGHMLQRVFKGTDHIFIMELLLLVELENFQQGDVIVRPGTAGDFMYFLDKGSVEVEYKGEMHTLIDGDYFGEIALEKYSKHNVFAEAVTPCRICSLSVHSYYRVLDHFPELSGKQLVQPFFKD